MQTAETVLIEERELLPKQMQFLTSTKRELLYSGAFRAGKSRALCEKVFEHARIPGNLVPLGRKKRADLYQTTLRTLFEEVLEFGSYEYKKSEHLIRLRGGGDIYLFGFDDQTKIASLSAGAIGIDQMEEIVEDEYMMCLGRLSRTVDPWPQLFGACNPAAPSHFLFQRFLKESHPDRQVIQTNTYENFFLPKSYFDIAETFTGHHRDRYILGKWVGMEGLIYDRWDRDIYVMERDGPWTWLIAGVDEGYTDPFAVGLWGMDGDGRLHLVKEIYQTHLLPAQKVEILKALGAGLYVVDPSAASLIADMQAAGLNAVPADNALEDGIRRMQNRFMIPGDGISRLTVSPFCTNFINEIEAYCWDEKKDRPKLGQADHLMDQARYVINLIDAGPLPWEQDVIVHPGRGDGVFRV